MFLFKHKDGRYYVIYTLDNGKRKTVSTGTTYKGEAHKFFSNLNDKIDFTDKTIKVNQTTFKLLERYYGNIELSELTRNKLEEYFRFRVKDSSI